MFASFGLLKIMSVHCLVLSILFLGLSLEYVRTGDDSYFWHVQMSPCFPTLTVAKPLDTEGTSGCQIKDMDLIFPLIPYGLL